jgi:hypothetical protein
MILIGPNKINIEIYSSGWKNYHETIENKIELVPLIYPDIISGNIEWQGISYPIVYNEFEYNELDRSIINYRLIYIPKDGYTSSVILYIRLNNNTIVFNKIIHHDVNDDIFQANIKLQFNEEIISQLEYTFGIRM